MFSMGRFSWVAAAVLVNASVTQTTGTEVVTAAEKAAAEKAAAEKAAVQVTEVGTEVGTAILFSPKQNGTKGFDPLVTDVIKYFDMDCWYRHCDEALEKCVLDDPACGMYFNVEGGPLAGYKDMKWSQISLGQKRVLSCAKDYRCTPGATMANDIKQLSKPESDNSELQPKIWAADVFRFYDVKCWMTHCEDKIYKCIKTDPSCAVFVEQDGIERKLKKTAWAALTKGQRSIAACATENKCAPDEDGLKLEERAIDDVKMSLAQVGEAPSSFLEVATHAQDHEGRDRAATAGLRQKASAAGARVAEKMRVLADAKARTESAAQHQRDAIDMLGNMQVQTLLASRREKSFVDTMRGRLRAAKSKLANLAKVTKPTAENMAELEQAQNEVLGIKATLRGRYTQFASKLGGMMKKL